MFQEIKALVIKDFRLEWRNKYALNGMFFYLVSTIFLCYVSFKVKVDSLNPIVWNTLFWIILLFTAINAIAKGFSQEQQARNLYYNQICSPESVILSKLLYHFVLMLSLGIVGIFIYCLLLQNPVVDMWQYLFSVTMGALGFSGILTLISGIAAKAANSGSLMALLSFPVIIPQILMLNKLSKNAMDGLAWSHSYDEILTLIGIDAIVLVLSYILFPYLWRS